MTGARLETSHVGEVEKALAEHFSHIRISALDRTADTPARVTALTLGSLAVGEFRFGFDFDYEAALDRSVTLFRMRAGTLIDSRSSRHVVFGAGDVGALTENRHLPLVGQVLGHAHYDLLTLDRSVLARVAGAPSASATGRLALTGTRPVSGEANTFMAGVIDHVARSTADVDVRKHPLLISALEQYLATALVATFPNGASRHLSVEGRDSGTPALLRRAIAFVDDHAQADISTTDIADAVYVTPRALQYMFRRHLDCTPTDYLRRVRLHHAHQELIAGDRTTITVGDVARHWGFLHTGRFAVYYRQHYGRSPHDTLRE